MDEDSRKYVAKYVEDMHSLLSHGLQPLEAQSKASQMKDHPEAQRFVQEAQRTLQGQVDRLNARLKSLGTSPTTAVQDAAAVVAGAVAGLYNQVRTEAISKSVRDDYTFLGACSVAYLMLMSTARSLGDHETEELAEQGYRESARLVMEIDHFMPTLVVQEMKADGLPASDVSDWAQKLVHGAWNRQSAGQTTSAPIV